jgi:hypothetical protein
MNVKVDFNELKEIIVDFLKLRKKPVDDIFVEWSIDFGADLNNGFLNDVSRLQESMRLFKRSMELNDLVTAQCALIRARAISMDLSNFFGSIAEDVERIAWTGGFVWPEIPDGYKIPDHYKYSDD